MVLAKTLGLNHKEWLNLRKKGIGGSDAGAICGLNPYVSAMDVYRDKTSEIIYDTDNEAMKQGRDLEEYVARRFTEETGLKVRRHNVIYQNEDYPFMLANVDRMLVGRNIGLECKTTSPFNAEKWENNQIPPHYLTQCYHYMAVTGAEVWYLAVLIYGKEFKYYRIERDEKAIRDLIKIEKLFWEHNVLKKVMPDPDGSVACDQIISEYFSYAEPDKSIELTGFNKELRRRAEIIDMIDRLEQEKKEIEQGVKVYMGDAEIAMNDDFRVSWKNTEVNRFDSKLLKEEHPEIYSKYCKKNNQRRFYVRACA